MMCPREESGHRDIHASETLKNWMRVFESEHRRPEAQSKGNLHANERREFAKSESADGTVKISEEDQVLRTST